MLFPSIPKEHMCMGLKREQIVSPANGWYPLFNTFSVFQHRYYIMHFMYLKKRNALRNHYNICLAISINQGHRSKIVALRVVKYNSASCIDEESPEEVSGY